MTKEASKVCVSVIMITYDHEQYIERAIQGVLKQKGDFRIELIIGNDASKDNTDVICRSFSEADPSVRYFLHEQNLGAHRNFGFCYEQCTGDYIALCEGDDEWVDELKIQKQLEEFKDSSIVMSFTDAEVNDIKDNMVHATYYNDRPASIYTKYDVFEAFRVPTCTVVFKNVLGTLPDWLFYTHAGAHFLFYLLSLKGEIKYLDVVTARYNRHYSGLAVKTNFISMLYDDTLHLGALKASRANDRKYSNVILRYQFECVDSLFHAGEIKKSIKLFWKVLSQAGSISLLNFQSIKLGLKIHLFPSYSKRKVEEYY